MSGPLGRRPAAPFETIAEALEEPAGRAAFARGLMLGALVGAAVVGSVLRARAARRESRAVPVARNAAGPVPEGPPNEEVPIA